MGCSSSKIKNPDKVVHENNHTTTPLVEDSTTVFESKTNDNNEESYKQRPNIQRFNSKLDEADNFKHLSHMEERKRPVRNALTRMSWNILSSWNEVQLRMALSKLSL